MPRILNSEVMGEPMEVITDKPAIACESPVGKDLLPNSLVSSLPAGSADQTTDEDTMQVDEEVTSSADTLDEKQKLTV